jgi:hypothetical protein
MRDKAAAFPVGLYGILLFALTWLTLPRVFAPVERVLVGAVCLVPRVASLWFGQPASAAEPGALARIAELGRDLEARVAAHDVSGARALLPVASEPVACSVLAVGRRGGGGQPSELRLDHSYAELDGCREIVTKDDALLGFLLRPGVGAAADDMPHDPARVLLVNHRDAPNLYGALADSGGASLRVVVRAAATVDPAPLRVDLWDDPYRAARIERRGQPVRTLPLSFGADTVPGGLLLGRTRIWGYEGEAGGEALTIGMFVVPPFEARALSHVVLWRDRPARADAGPVPALLQSRRRVAAKVYDLPGAVHGRHLLVAGCAVPDGAAVVQNGLFLGTARGLAFGTGLVTSFVASRQPWSLLLLPDAAEAEPRELHARVVRTDGNVAWLDWGAGSATAEPPGPGYLFTGSNGPHCPAGLWIGRALPHAFERDLLQVTTPPLSGPHTADVFVGGPP